MSRKAACLKRSKIMKPNIGITDKDCAGVVKILTNLLADEYVLYTKTRNYHWNIVGQQFNDLHKFFESQYEELNDIVDDVANFVAYIASPVADFINGTNLRVDGGFMAAMTNLSR